MKINVTTSIDDSIYTKAKENNISWNDALEFGISFLIAEKEGYDYPSNKLLIKIANFQEKISELSLKLEENKNGREKQESG